MDGILTTTNALLYRVGAASRAEIVNILLVNTAATEVRVNLYADVSGTQRPISPVGSASLSLKGGRMSVEAMPLLLGPGQAIYGLASANSSVTYILCGRET